MTHPEPKFATFQILNASARKRSPCSIHHSEKVKTCTAGLCSDAALVRHGSMWLQERDAIFIPIFGLALMILSDPTRSWELRLVCVAVVAAMHCVANFINLDQSPKPWRMERVRNGRENDIWEWDEDANSNPCWEELHTTLTRWMGTTSWMGYFAGEKPASIFQSLIALLLKSRRSWYHHSAAGKCELLLAAPLCCCTVNG